MIDHIQEALDRLPARYRNDPNAVALVTALVRPAQHLETALEDLLTKRQVDTAVGAQLDVVGRKVGQKRNGLDDTTYRRYIRARIWTNRSTGGREDVIRIAQLVLDDSEARIVVDTQGIAAYVLRIEDIAVAAELADLVLDFLQDGTSAGVRVIVESNTAAPDQAFRFAPGTTTFASLNLLLASGNIDTVVEALVAGAAGNAITITVVADAAYLQESGTSVTIGLDPGVTTISGVESLISKNSRLIRVKTPSGSGGTVASSSTETPVNLTGGVNGNGLGFPRLAGRQLNDTGLTVNVDTFVRSRIGGVAGNTQTITFVNDGAGAGTLTDGAAAVFHYAPGVTTVANFETAIASSVYLSVYLAGTPATALTNADNGKVATLIGGQDGGRWADARA